MSNLNRALTRWKEVILIVFIIRVSCLMFSFFINHQNLSNLINYWIKWDSPHYIDIAKAGYQTSGENSLFIVFYPLYPILIKFFSLIITDYNLSAILVSLIFCFVASILLYELVSLDFNKKIAILSVWFLNIFPTSYFLQAGYSESTFMSVSLATVLLYRKNEYLKAGLSGFLSALTRINGLLLLPLLFLETKTPRRNFIPFLLTSSGFITYLLINYFLFNDPFYFKKPLIQNWYKGFEWPWVSIQNLIHSLEGFKGLEYYYFALSELLSIIILFLASLYILLKVRISYGVYMFLHLALFTSTSFILSTPRYSLVLFPIYIALAQIKDKFVLICVSIVSITLMLILSSFFTQGKWAF